MRAGRVRVRAPSPAAPECLFASKQSTIGLIALRVVGRRSSVAARAAESSKLGTIRDRNAAGPNAARHPGATPFCLDAVARRRDGGSVASGKVARQRFDPLGFSVTLCGYLLNPSSPPARQRVDRLDELVQRLDIEHFDVPVGVTPRSDMSWPLIKLSECCLPLVRYWVVSLILAITSLLSSGVRARFMSSRFPGRSAV
jgi:hypothetical protein